MKKLLVLMLPAMLLVGCRWQTLDRNMERNEISTDTIIDAPNAEEEGHSAEDEKIIDFLTPIYKDTNAYLSMCDEDWVKENCTKKCMEKLVADYDFDGEGYAVYWMVGHNPGEAECTPELRSIEMVEHKGRRVAKVQIYRSAEDIIRTIFVDCVIEGEKVMINGYEWGEDVEAK